MDAQFLLFLLVATAFMALNVALQGWSLGRRLRGGGLWGFRSRPPDVVFGLPRAIARHAWPAGILAAALYVAGASGVALDDALPWGIVAFLGLALGAWVASSVVTTRVLEANREAMETLPPVDWRSRIGWALIGGAAWSVAFVALSLATGWPDMPELMAGGVAIYAAALAIVGLFLVKRSRDAAARQR